MNLKRNTLISILIVIVLLAGVQVKADFIFGTPKNCGPAVNTASYGEYGPSISSDGLTLYFADGAKWPCRPQGFGDGDIWVTTRQTLNDEWAEPVNIGPTINTASLDGTPFISADGLSLYFSSIRAGDLGEGDLYVSTRPALDAPWEEPLNLGANVNSNSPDIFPCVSGDGLTLHFVSYRSGEGDIFAATRQSVDEPFGLAWNIGSPISTPDVEEGTPWVSPDGHVMLFTRWWEESWDIFMSRRSAVDESWAAPVNLGPPVSIPDPGDESGASFTADGTRFFFHGGHTGGYGYTDLWEAEVLPVVDLNDDGIVDAEDMCIILDNWGTDEPLCDIGPTPFGDGIVDVQDLIVLAEHLFEQTTPVE